MKKLCVYAILLMGLLGGAAWAQTPGMQNDSLSSYYDNHMAVPAEIRQLLDENKAKEAVAEYEKFKKTAQADALDLLLLDAEVYGTAAFIEPGSNYGKMREDAVKKMLEIAPNNTEVLMLTMPEDGNPDESLKILNKMIDSNPDYLPAYIQRFYIYKEKKMMKEACMDYMKLPEESQVGLLDPGMNCSKVLETANK